MPNALTAPEPVVAAQPDLLAFLRGRDNPFDVFVAARQPDADFPRLHVPSLYPEICGALLAVFERFRPERLEVDSDMPRSGVVVVLGRRGTGKTHLLHVLRHGLDGGATRVLVAPAIFEPHRPFLEYLLHQLVRHFQNESEQSGRGVLDLLADAFARQVLAQALHGLTEIDWLARNVSGRFGFWQGILGWGTRRLVKTKRSLIQDLDGGRGGSLLEIIAQHEQSPADMKCLTLEQLERTETAATIAGQIRHGLYRRLIDRAFGTPADELHDFLLDGYTQVEAKNEPSRATLVDALFQALLELCLLARTPIVFTFDALEALLGDPPDQRLAQLFFQGIAEVLDAHRGLPFLLLAESGHWLAAQKSISPYAQQRFEQGVIRVPTFGTVSTLYFPEVSPKQLGDIVATRMEPLLEDCRDAAEEVSPIYPFTREDLERICRTEGNRPPLRQALQALRDRFEQIVHGKKAPVPVITPAMTSAVNLEPLESRWQQETRAAKKRLDTSLGNSADELHAGLLRWLECLVADGTKTAQGRPSSPLNEVLGSHPTYGQVTRCQWLHEGAKTDIGIGLLLGAGAGMPRDLDTKLKMLAAQNGTLAHLILLWPRGGDLAPPVEEHFPPSTRDIWNKHEKKGTTAKVCLRAIDQDQLLPWLALPRWLSAVQTEVEGLSPDLVHHFVAERTAPLLALVSPKE